MNDNSTRALIFGGGILLGSALAFGAAYGVSRYMMERMDDRPRDKHRSRNRWASPGRSELARIQTSSSPRVSHGEPPSRLSTSQLTSGRSAEMSRQASAAPGPSRMGPNAELAPFANGSDIITPIGQSPPSFSLMHAPVPASQQGPGNGSGGGSKGLPRGQPSAISPLLASPRNAAFVRSETLDYDYRDVDDYGRVSDSGTGARRSELGTTNGSTAQGGQGERPSGARPVPPSRRETDTNGELHPTISPSGLAGAAAVAGLLSTAPPNAGQQLAAAAGAPGTVPFFPTMVPADRANKAALDLVKATNKTVSHMPKNVSSGNLQAMAAAAANAAGASGSGGLTHHLLAAAAAQASSAHMSISPPPDKNSKAGDLAIANNEDYCRVITPEVAMNEEIEEACAMIVESIELRKKWLFQPLHTPEQRKGEAEAAMPSEVVRNPLDFRPLPNAQVTYRMVDGVMRVWGDESCEQELFPVPGTAAEFFTNMHRILRYAALGPVKSFCHHRLMLMEQKFNLHVMLNADKEFLSQKAAPHRDFYNVRKVDTHIHHSACMHQKHLLRFIKSKLRKEPDEVVIFRDGKYLTLKEVFESLNLTGYDLNVDTLDMHADKSLFHRFDRFNLKYNPCGQSRLREIFIKQDNLIHGRFLAELTREVFSDLEASKYQHAEMRISVYGRKAMEWDILASWVVANNLYSDNNVWLIQIPRLYNVYKETGVIDNFQQMLDNIFEPLFEVTNDPSSHPYLHVLLSQVVGFDMVDDESKPERRPTKHCPPPADWNSKHNCAYSYYAYYIYANLYTLNKFRESRGLNTFSFRPHAGEAGDVDHLASAFMLCENIAHGINLRKSPMLQYLYYLTQIGLCMSPLSNNSLFLDYHRNPFPSLFARGLSVSLSTDDPLQIHLTKEPLVEEYSVAAQVWKLSSADLCEIARNGVLHSGFPHACKKHWVAGEYWRPGPDGNDIHKTNVPNLRLRFRYDTYMDEMRLVAHGALAYNARKQSAAAKE
eukprot:CAMPEP_0202859138 /NCGR_PEP_ID=MMETSP1391-20130828/1384_1 /ASSEMBLY_ACC=CAM_ASM_000867 /TAXON_ID=1034604 /ORGANISM="Chlamydomonas leiostraca, Strain SAG 11-49" /LENGTH=996 /DNA_ID=CAMNT_0049538147 /DNA_START=131 /DNA_END=3121 /DNA_ORIENTATION=+